MVNDYYNNMIIGYHEYSKTIMGANFTGTLFSVLTTWQNKGEGISVILKYLRIRIVTSFHQYFVNTIFLFLSYRFRKHYLETPVSWLRGIQIQKFINRHPAILFKQRNLYDANHLLFSAWDSIPSRLIFSPGGTRMFVD